MAITANYSAIYSGNIVSSVMGSASSDAVAQPTQAGTTTSGNDTITGVASTTGFLVDDVVRVVGTTQKFLHVVRTVTANTSLRLWDALRTTASESVTVTKLAEFPFYFDMPFRARSVEWTDETNGVTWTWREDMPQASAYKRVWSTGVQTLETGVGLLLFQNKLCVGSDVAPVSSVFRFRIDA